MMEVPGPSKMLVPIYKCIWCQISEELIINFLTFANLWDYIKTESWCLPNLGNYWTKSKTLFTWNIYQIFMLKEQQAFANYVHECLLYRGLCSVSNIEFEFRTSVWGFQITLCPENCTKFFSVIMLMWSQCPTFQRLSLSRPLHTSAVLCPWPYSSWNCVQSVDWSPVPPTFWLCQRSYGKMCGGSWKTYSAY
jgi:hypothetical protein